MNWALMPLRRYTDFKGRSRRKEYWMFLLGITIVGVGLVLLGAILTGGFGRSGERSPLALLGLAPFGLFYLAMLLPSIAVQVRRLHDRNLSGWLLLGVYLLSWVPVLGFLLSVGFLVITCLPGTPGPNRYGPDPKEDLAEAFR
ncbi:DUF805 domain-containing protein [Sphingomonas spermidinifaciens]|uniref:DUF805 domain-containing protein n=1 Tax=Sphingomonas spermidinifaciens TaxID=1141889 RepID=A0A2A4BAP6_9SPHN|nr:DUF805 domain-containing protein [Sphingomonas spermidinifaciens]PCD04819.1 DUF805 domain-containing protein [Sphingomonas spermidinifaciens]